MVGDDTVLLCRVEDRRGFSHLTVARSADGVSNWVVDDSPADRAVPADHPEEEWGVEDPRITRVDELDAWVIAYTAFGRGGPAVVPGHHPRLPVGGAPGCGLPARGQERVAAAPPGQRRVRAVPPAGRRDRRPRRCLDLPIARPAQLGNAGAGVRRPAGRLVGLGADRRRPAPAGNRARAGWWSTTACGRPSPVRCTGSAWRCSTSRTRRWS